MLTALQKSRIMSSISDLYPNLRFIDNVPSKPGDGGDDALWLGLLAVAGVQEAKTGMPLCQARAGAYSGMFFRSPTHRLEQRPNGGAWFSRDMATGVLLWLSSSAPKLARMDAARAWITYINKDSSRECLKEKPRYLGGGCWLRSPIYRYAPDTDHRSDITPNMWALMGRVWNYLGLPLDPQMRAFAGADGDYPLVEARTLSPGYELHLKACDALLKLQMGASTAYAQKMADICYGKAPWDLFYKVLKNRGAAAADVTAFTDVCNTYKTKPFSDRWCWGYRQQSGFYDACCGWDLVFMGNLMLKFG